MSSKQTDSANEAFLKKVRSFYDKFLNNLRLR